MGVTLEQLTDQREMMQRAESVRQAQADHAERQRLRDQFAAAALTGLLSSMQKNVPADELASHAYEAADAMMAQRERP